MQHLHVMCILLTTITVIRIERIYCCYHSYHRRAAANQWLNPLGVPPRRKTQPHYIYIYIYIYTYTVYDI